MSRFRWEVGDLALVADPQVVTRIGYPKAVEDYVAELALDPNMNRLLRELVLHVAGRFDPEDPHVLRILRELGHVRALRDGFGGKVRTIHTKPEPALEGAEVRIISMRRVCVGTYQPPRGSTRDDSWEPGRLGDREDRRIAKVQVQRDLYDLYEVPLENLRWPGDGKPRRRRKGAS